MKIVVIVHFSIRDGIRKVVLDMPHDTTAADMLTQLRQSLPDATIDRVEYYNSDTNTFQEKHDMTERLVIAEKFLSVLVVESTQHIPGLPLLIEGRAFDVPSSGLLINGKSLRINEMANRSEGTGLNTWDGSIVLAKYLEVHPQLVQGRQVLEVGAGTGVAGLAAHILGARLAVLTDQPYALPNLQSNVNGVLGGGGAGGPERGEVRVLPLDWGEPATYVYPAPPGGLSTSIQPGADSWDVILGSYHLPSPVLHHNITHVDTIPHIPNKTA